MASVEVLAGPERRRRWIVEQKQAIVGAAFGPGAVVRDVARRADVTPSLIYRRRRDLRAAANGFAQVLVAPAGDGVAVPAVPAIEIEFVGSACVRIHSQNLIGFGIRKVAHSSRPPDDRRQRLPDCRELTRASAFWRVVRKSRLSEFRKI
jgi:transposase